MYGSRESQSVRSRTWPGPGSGTGALSSRKSVGFGSPTGREASTMRRFCSVTIASQARCLIPPRRGGPTRAKPERGGEAPPGTDSPPPGIASLATLPCGEGSRHLEQPGGAHAAADAHRADDVLGAAALALDEGVADHAGAAHAVGVADRDRAAVDVERVVRDAELVAAVEHLHRERFVQLPQIDVVDRQAVALQQARDREHGTDTHLVGLAAG